NKGGRMQTKSMPKIMLCAMLIAMGFAVTGCQRLGQPGKAPQVGAIPAGIGELGAVTPGERPYQCVLGVKQPEQTIVAVYVNTAHGTISGRMTKFPRS